MNGGNLWYVWDITALAQDWIKHGRPNYGLLFVGEGASYRFAAQEGAYAPSLVVHYDLPTPTLTPTQTYTPTPTPTLGPSATPTNTIAPSPTVMTGGETYAPWRDTYISQWHTTTNYDDEELLVVRQGDILASLVQFNVSAIAPGTEVHNAYLQLWVADRSNTGGMRVSAYKVRREWYSDAATWLKATSSTAWSQSGCNGEGSDRDAEEAASRVVEFENAG